MKKKNIGSAIVLILILTLILGGCKKKEEKIQIKEPVENTENSGEEVEEKEEEKDNNKLIEEFDKLIEEKSSPEILVEYVNENVDKLTSLEANHMVSELEKSLEESLDKKKEKLEVLDGNNELIKIIGEDLFFSQDNIEKIENDELREEVSNSLKSKYKLVNLEGEIYPIIDYEGFKKYNEYISPELADYIEIKSMDSQLPLAIDAALNISYDELAERILKTEEYIKQYSEGQRYEELLKAYRSKLIIYLSGTDNSPLYDRDTGKFHDKVIESYRKTSNTKDTSTGFIIRKHLKDIEEADYIMNEDIKNNILSLVNEALSLLEISK